MKKGPRDVAAEARRLLARFRLPAEHKRPCPPPPADVPSRGKTEPAAPGCTEPSVPGAATATPERPRPTVAETNANLGPSDDNARADAARPSNIGRLARLFSISRGSRPRKLDDRVMPPFPCSKLSETNANLGPSDDNACADAGRPSNIGRLAQLFSISRGSRPSKLGDRVMPPLLPSRSNGSEFVGGSVKESGPQKETEEEEEALFSHDSEKDVYKEYLESIRRKCEQQDLPETEAEGVMEISLHKYQKMGLDWMRFREKSSHCAGGILADQMGLGKTVQMIALILEERAEQSKFISIDSDRDREATVVNKEPKDLLIHQEPAHHVAKPAGGTLLVCLKSIMTQWKEELSRKIKKDAKLSVHVYYGCSRTTDSQELAKHDVVITTYKMVKQHFNSRKKLANKKPSASDGHKSNPIAGVRWFRIVLDEAHEIRNGDSLVAQACCELEAKRRWCISGTPMQNKFDDLYSYLRFLRFKPYSEYTSFCSLLKKQNSTDKFRDQNSTDACWDQNSTDACREQNSTDACRGKTKLKMLWEIVLLQRTKDTHIDGEPIIKLPPLTIQMREIIFTPAEQEFYSWLLQCYKEILRDYTFHQILAVLKERQLACDHPCLVKSRNDYKQCSTIFERSYVSSKMKAIIDILNSIVNKRTFTSDTNIESAPEKVLIFSQFTMMLDLLQPLLNSNDIQFRRFDGKMNRKARDEAVEDFDRNPEVTVMLVSLKAAGAGLNLVAASHVIITDPWWNPFAEDQAIGRAHRIGQTRPVTVYRLVVKGPIETTIEERALVVQETKRKNVKRVYEGGIFSHGMLSKDDIKFLWG